MDIIVDDEGVQHGWEETLAEATYTHAPATMISELPSRPDECDVYDAVPARAASGNDEDDEVLGRSPSPSIAFTVHRGRKRSRSEASRGETSSTVAIEKDKRKRRRSRRSIISRCEPCREHNEQCDGQALCNVCQHKRILCIWSRATMKASPQESAQITRATLQMTRTRWSVTAFAPAFAPLNTPQAGKVFNADNELSVYHVRGSDCRRSGSSRSSRATSPRASLPLGSSSPREPQRAGEPLPGVTEQCEELRESQPSAEVVVRAQTPSTEPGLHDSLAWLDDLVQQVTTGADNENWWQHDIPVDDV